MKTMALLEAKDYSDAFRRLYNVAQGANPRISLAFICRRLALKSRGHLSDVLNGRRRMGRDRFDKIVSYFKLDDVETAFLKALRDLEYAKSSDALHAANQRVNHLRKVLTVSYEILPDQLMDLFFAFKVFAAFGLFGHKATLKQLVDFFGAERKKDIEAALKKLVLLNMCVSKDSWFEVNQNIVLFNATGDGLSHTQFIKQTLMDAALGVEQWFSKPTQSRFHSTILSVNREKYTKYLQELRTRLIEDQTNLESSDADMLVHYNIQIYPVESAPNDHL